jgi:hypothetical protein
MASLYYWDGTNWMPISTGGGGDGGGSPGPAGPAGADGKSVNVFGPQIPQPIPERKGDMWLAEAAPKVSTPPAEPLAQPPDYQPAQLADHPIVEPNLLNSEENPAAYLVEQRIPEDNPVAYLAESRTPEDNPVVYLVEPPCPCSYATLVE